MTYAYYPIISSRIIAWYQENARPFPWRTAQTLPYHTWVSEVMLQQTTTTTVVPYFVKFIERWPTVEALAKAPEDDILKAWEGLGYYRRARMLHKAAQHVHQQLNNTLPSELKELLKLPGVGLYTASAIRAIGFNQRAAAMDGNIERIFARLFNIETPLPKAKKIIYEHLEKSLPESHFSDYTQGLMDLGATICTPKNPQCHTCPLMTLCLGKEQAHLLPYKTPKKPLPLYNGFVLYIISEEQEILIGKRDTQELFKNMFFLPSSLRIPHFPKDEILPIEVHYNLQKLQQEVTHTFTHFKQHLTLYTLTINHHLKKHLENCIKNSPHLDPLSQYQWIKRENLNHFAFPTLIHKALAYYHA